MSHTLLVLPDTWDLLGGAVRDEATPAAFAGAAWFSVPRMGAGLRAALATPIPAAARWLTFDLLLAGRTFITCRLRVLAGSAELASYGVGALHGCQTRLVFAVDGVALARADAVELIVIRTHEAPARFCLGPLTFSVEPPPVLEAPAVVGGALLDELGQSPRHPCPETTRDAATMIARLRDAARTAAAAPPVPERSRWGGWAARRVAATGFFRTHHDGQRWWLVDPDGCLFWSAGLDCVHVSIDHETRVRTRWQNFAPALAWLPPATGEFAAAHGHNPRHDPQDREFSFLVANFIRAFGPERWYAAWGAATVAELRALGVNTFGDWSDEALGRRAAFPYTRPLELGLRFTRTPLLVGSFPDVFAPGLAADAADYAAALAPTADDPALLGYFLHNEPGWWFGDGSVSPAVELLRRDARGPGRAALVERLRARYRDDAGLRAAWQMPAADFARLAAGPWPDVFTPAATRDLDEFSTELLRRLFDALNAACRAVDPHHLNLGVRWWTFPPRWALAAMGGFDVISFNCYQPRPDQVHYGRRSAEPGVATVLERLGRPCLIGEWHFGSLDGGLPSAGLYAAADQAARGLAYRVYLEHAASLPWCVGAHWFNLYDRNALYCNNAGENYAIGFLDLTHRRHEPLCQAARETHARLYPVAAGATPPFLADVPFIFPSR